MMRDRRASLVGHDHRRVPAVDGGYEDLEPASFRAAGAVQGRVGGQLGGHRDNISGCGMTGQVLTDELSDFPNLIRCARKYPRPAARGKALGDAAKQPAPGEADRRRNSDRQILAADWAGDLGDIRPWTTAAARASYENRNSFWRIMQLRHSYLFLYLFHR